MSVALNPALVADSRAVLALHARSFRWASVFLPASQRDDAAVVYATCRWMDDLVDEAPSEYAAREGVELARRQLSGFAPSPLVLAYRALCAERGIGLGPANSLLDGMAYDLDPVRVATDDELLRYCYRVAGTVGLMMCGVLGVTDPRALAHAIDLGVAMQLTNICRDVKEDAARDRVYLPADRLARLGADQDDILRGEPDRAAVTQVTRDLLTLSDIYYRSGREGLRYIPFRARVAIAVASRVYGAIGGKLRATGGDPWKGRTVVGVGGKLMATLGALLGCLSPTVLGLSRAKPHRERLHDALRGLPGVADPGEGG